MVKQDSFILNAFSRDVANAILNSDKWKEALRNDTSNMKDGTRNTPMRKLIRKMPGELVAISK